jgi:CelD/BcsL family acetyltransferase involved in cellulose biosynthesis
MRYACGEYGYPLAAWALTGPDGTLTAALPVALLRSRLTGTRLIALPFSDRCPPLIAGADPLAFARALEAQRGELTLDVRGDVPEEAGAAVTRTFLAHETPLERDVAAVEGRFTRGSVRRGIAKARREGVTVERRTDAEALARFYRLHLITRRRQGVPTQAKRFVLRLERLFAQGLGFVLLARQHGRDVAAAVFLTDGATLTYQLGASDHRLRASRPNHLIFMEAIRWGCETGHRTLDLGRTDLDNHGLAEFKASWGAEVSTLRYHRFGGTGGGGAPGGPLRGALAHAIHRAPPQFGRLVGAALYRHLG